jgi:hypothetical protein
MLSIQYYFSEAMGGFMEQEVSVDIPAVVERSKKIVSRLKRFVF